MYKKKRGALEISVGAIVTLILALTFLSMGLVFVKGMLGKVFMNFDEQISEEPNPPNPTISHHITFSRNPIITTQDTVEVIKVSILNPTLKDWNNRNFARVDELCGKADGICYIDDADPKCNSKSASKNNDPDCEEAGLFGLSCEEDSEEDPCLISNVEDLFCPYITQENREPDCEPSEGIEMYLSCDPMVMEEPFNRNVGKIKVNDFKSSILLVRINSRVPDDQYLCKLHVFAEDYEYMEDLVVKIQNE